MSKVKALRVKLGLTQEQMAEAMYMSPSTISRLERGVMVESARIMLQLVALKTQKEEK